MSRLGEAAWGIASLSAPYWSREQLLRYQSRRLRYLVNHCYREVPFYRRSLTEAAIDPARFRGLEDLEKLPILRRADLQSAGDDILAASRAKLSMRVNRTSGSSGAPIALRKTPFEYWLLMTTQLLTATSIGLRPWESRFQIGRIRDGNYKQDWWTRLGILRREVVDCLEPMPDILEKIRKARPLHIGGYSGMVAAVAAALTDEDRKIIRPHTVGCGAETVTPAMRRTIESAFGVPLRVGYGAHEFNSIATQCMKTGLFHLRGANVIAEVTRGGKAVEGDEPAEILITGLQTHAMPILRYALGDLVRKGPDPCPCGAPFATLVEIQGRQIEMFHLPDGTQLHPYALVATLTHGSPWLKHYQLIQERRDWIRVRVVGLEQATPEQREQTRLAMENACGGGVRLEFESVGEIRPEANGKFRPYFSLVKPE